MLANSIGLSADLRTSTRCHSLAVHETGALGAGLDVTPRKDNRLCSHSHRATRWRTGRRGGWRRGGAVTDTGAGTVPCKGFLRKDVGPAGQCLDRNLQGEAETPATRFTAWKRSLGLPARTK